MTTLDQAAMPAWVRPIRIPEDVAVEHADPPFAAAGERGTWTLPFRLSRNIPAGATLFLQAHGGRNNKGPFRSPDAGDRPMLSPCEGQSLGVRPAQPDGTYEVTVGVDGLREGDIVTFDLGAAAGAVAPSVRQLNKFFVLYAPDLLEDSSVWDVAETMLSGQGRHERTVRAVGGVWGDEAQRAIVGACTIHILGGAIHHLRAYAPAGARPGEPFRVLVRPEDERGNLSHQRLESAELFLEERRLDATADPVPESTCLRLQVALDAEGVHRLRVVGPNGREAVANPIRCTATPGADNVCWGMIHGHTEMSDGQGDLDYYFRQMRDEAALDFAATGDHDHGHETPDRLWHVTCDAVARWNTPGRFVTFLGYEWAKWRKNGDGDRNVYYLHDGRPMYRSDDDILPHPPDLFAALRDETAIVIPHHTGHAGNFCDFKDHDPVHERLVEIFQLRGSYERPDDNPVPERGKEPPKACGFVSRALAMGWRVGFTAGGDDHIGHAGTDYAIPSVNACYQAGLMAVLAADRTREAIWDAMWSRRVVATTGPRILLRYQVSGEPMGSELRVAATPELAERRELCIEFHGTAPVQRVDVIRSNDIVHTFTPGVPDGELAWADETPLADVLLPPAKYCDHPFAFYYVRLVQSDGHVAWASPVWIDPERGRPTS